MTDRAIATTLADLGLTLPAPVAPTATYVPATEFGGLLHVAGQLAYDEHGRLPLRGRLGAEIDLPAGQACAERCALHLLAQLQAQLGSIRRLERLLKVNVYVASTPDFSAQHLVANGASDLLGAVLGPAAPHARSAFGVAALPFESPVEVDAVVAVAPDDSDVRA
ncbi:MAG: RidA family protein [Actinobacteria bacterium]|nr:RidA family protein [Actinomycetota bacterium]